MKKEIIMAGVLAWFTGLFGCGKDSQQAVATSDQFAVGQIWEYKTRPGEEGSRVIVGKIESIDKVGKVVHVKLSGLKIRNPGAPGGYSTTMGHAPVLGEKLKESVTKLAGHSGDLEGFQEGYSTWLKEHRSGKAGVFSITLREIVDSIEQAITNGSPAR